MTALLVLAGVYVAAGVVGVVCGFGSRGTADRGIAVLDVLDVLTPWSEEALEDLHRMGVDA